MDGPEEKIARLVDEYDNARLAQVLASANVRLMGNSEKQALAQRLGKHFGVPTSVARESLSEYEQRFQMCCSSDILRRNPGLLEQMIASVGD